MPKLDEIDDTDRQDDDNDELDAALAAKEKYGNKAKVNPLESLDKADLFIYSKTGVKDVENPLEVLRTDPVVRHGAEAFADSLAATIEAEDRASQEAAAAAHAKRQAEEFETELERKKAEVRAERKKAAEEEANTAREAKLRAEAEAALESEVAVGAGGAESELETFRHLEMQRGQLDYRSDEANEIREQQIELAASMERGGDQVTADVDPAEFERSL